MRKVSMQLVRLIVGLLLLCPMLGRTQERQLIALPPPQMEGGTPIMQALKARRSSREFSPEPLPAQILSNLLWAAFGINRPEFGGRTAPSTHNREIFERSSRRRVRSPHLGPTERRGYTPNTRHGGC